jgi:hypothetical protein
MNQALAWSAFVRDTSQSLRLLNDLANVIAASTDLTAEQKAEQLAANLQMRNETARNAVSIIRASDYSGAITSSFFNDSRNDRPQPNLAREAIRFFRGE